MRFVLALALTAASAACLAHGELPTATWCAQGRPVPVAAFEFAGAWLKPEAEQCPSDGTITTRECGQFDDDYEGVRKMAVSTCQVHARRGIGDIGSVVFVVDQPGSFLSSDHHALYKTSHGLKGSCVRCEAPLREILLEPR